MSSPSFQPCTCGLPRSRRSRSEEFSEQPDPLQGLLEEGASEDTDPGLDHIVHIEEVISLRIMKMNSKVGLWFINFPQVLFLQHSYCFTGLRSETLNLQRERERVEAEKAELLAQSRAYSSSSSRLPMPVPSDGGGAARKFSESPQERGRERDRRERSRSR